MKLAMDDSTITRAWLDRRRTNPMVDLFKPTATLAKWMFTFVALLAMERAAVAQTLAVQVRLTDQNQVDGQIISGDIDTLRLRVAEQEKIVSIDDVNVIQFQETENLPTGRATRVRLMDGSIFVVTRCNLANERFELTLPDGQLLKVAKRHVRAITFSDAGANSKLNARVDGVLDDRTIVADALLVTRDGQFNAIEGLVKQLTPSTVQFTIDDQTADVALKKISAITFFKAAAQATIDQFDDPLAIGTLVDGSQLRLRSFTFQDNRLTGQTLAGVPFDLSFDRLRSLDFDSTTLVPLVRLPTSTNDWSPLVVSDTIQSQLRRLRLARLVLPDSDQGLPVKVARDPDLVSRGKTPLVTKVYDSGIVIYGGGRLAWRLDGGYQAVRGKIGFAPRASFLGRVIFRVIVDGRTRTELMLKNTSHLEPVDFDVSLIDGQRMIFEVDYADGSSIGDLLHLVDVVLEK